MRRAAKSGSVVRRLVLCAVLASGWQAAGMEASLALPGAPVPKVDFALWEVSAPPAAEALLVQEAFGTSADGVLLGGEGKYGPKYGVEPKAPIAVTAGSRCEIAFEGRVRELTSTFVVYATALDAQGRNISDTVPAPGWSYSPYTHAYYKLEITLSATGTWERVALPFIVPDGAAALRLSVSPWRGKGVFCRSIAVTEKKGLVYTPVDFDRREEGPSGRVVYTSMEKGLSLTARPEDLSFSVTVVDVATPPRPRALRLQTKVAKPLQGWTWHRNWRTDVVVEGTSVLRDDQAYGGHPVSSYPFSAVSKDGAGFALATPIDEVVYEYRSIGSDGIVSTVPVGLLARPAGGTSATYRWQVFPFTGTWGFRSAARAYYALQGEKLPRPRAGAQEGTWLWPVWPSKAPEKSGDFGLTFWEAPPTIAKHPEELAAAHARGIEAFPYTEAWGMRQVLETGADGKLPSVEARLAELKRWAATNEPGKVWFDAPRHIAAQAALNSLPVCPDGAHPFKLDRWDHWTHWWRTNADPRLAHPCRASLCWDYTVGLDLDAVDGVYLDSLSYGFAVAFQNVRPEHLAVMDEPLVYDVETARPCADGMQHQVAFVRWLAERLHAKNKRVFGNVFNIAHRFHATTVDIFGSEVGGWGREGGEVRFHETLSDGEACEKRFFAYHRPVSDLLQEGHYEHVTPEFSATAMTNYVARQVFYAFYPGVSTIGGEERPGYANWRRYFDARRRCERDRDLFKAAVPLIRRLNAAGWQPETGVRSSDARVWIERYGVFGKDCLITLRNASKDNVEAILTPEVGVSALKPLWQGSPEAEVDTTGWKVRLAPWQTAVYGVMVSPVGK